MKIVGIFYSHHFTHGSLRWNSTLMVAFLHCTAAPQVKILLILMTSDRLGIINTALLRHKTGR